MYVGRVGTLGTDIRTMSHDACTSYDVARTAVRRVQYEREKNSSACAWCIIIICPKLRRMASW